MPILHLLAIVFLAGIVFDSPVGKALGEAIRNLVPPRAPDGARIRAELEEPDTRT